MANPVIQPGLSAQAIHNYVPDGPLDGAWFRRFCIQFLVHADARNAVAGAGAAISGTIGQPATIGTTGIPLTALAPIANDTVLGNVSGLTEPPVALNQAQLTSLVNNFTNGLAGDVPASGGGTTNFLRADGSWVAPPGGTVSPLTTKGDVWGYDTGNNRIPVGADGTVLVASSAQALGVKWGTSASDFTAANVQIFDQTGGASQTYTVPPNAKWVKIIAIGGGGGGGSGGLGVVGSSWDGGGGGGGGGITILELPASALGSSQTITFSNAATGGNGGPSQTTSGVQGHPGTAGSNAQFGNFCIAYGGANGIATTGGAGGTGMWQSGTSGGTGSSSTGQNGVSLSNQSVGTASFGCTGGGAGGGLTTGSTRAGGNGGAGAASLGFNFFVGGTPGAGGAGTTNGNAATGVSAVNGAIYGAAGSGGGGSCNGLGVAGGQGGGPGGYGSGGGGGGAATPTGGGAGSSGAGGQGGYAAVICVAW